MHKLQFESPGARERIFLPLVVLRDITTNYKQNLTNKMSLVFLRNHLHEYDCAHNHQNIHLANIATMVAMNTLAFVLVETRFLSDYLDLAHFS